MTYTLTDGEEMNAAHPESFLIPDAITRHNLTPGTLVKLGFEAQGTTERMWVIVTAVSDGSYTGELNNNPATDDLGINAGHVVTFEPKHVLDVWEKAA